VVAQAVESTLIGKHLVLAGHANPPLLPAAAIPSSNGLAHRQSAMDPPSPGCERTTAHQLHANNTALIFRCAGDRRQNQVGAHSKASAHSRLHQAPATEVCCAP
jgi:hypothetical protein